MKKVLTLAVLVCLNLVTFSCSDDDSNEMKQSNAELQIQAIEKGEIEPPGDRRK